MADSDDKQCILRGSFGSIIHGNYEVLHRRRTNMECIRILVLSPWTCTGIFCATNDALLRFCECPAYDDTPLVKIAGAVQSFIPSWPQSPDFGI